MSAVASSSVSWSAIQPLIERLAESVSLERVGRALVQELPAVLGTRDLLIAAPLPGGWIVVAAAGAFEPLARPDAAMPSAIANAAASRAPVRTELEGRATLAVPLVVRNRPRGALLLSVGSAEPPADLLGVVALQSALALDRALLHEEESDHRAELEASEERFRSLVHELDAVFWECDPVTFQFSFISKRAEAMLGYPSEAWLQPGFWASILHPEDRHWAVGFCVDCTRDGQDHAFEYRLIAKNGEVRWFRDVVYVLRDGEGRVAKLRGVMLDITQERRDDRRVARRIKGAPG